jgi:hypothetical protein
MGLQFEVHNPKAKQTMARQLSVELFENLVYSGQTENAAEVLAAILQSLEYQWGSYEGIACLQNHSVGIQSSDAHTSVRLASAATALFANRQMRMSQTVHKQLINLHRVLHTVFLATDFGNADHVLKNLAAQPFETPEAFSIQDAAFALYSLFYGPNSGYPLLIEKHPKPLTGLAMRFAAACLTSHLCVTPAAEVNRNKLLHWFAQKLNRTEDLSIVPLDLLPQVYMSCTYSLLQSRHEVKKSINRIMRLYLKKTGLDFTFRPPSIPDQSRPTMVVVIDHVFSTQHAVYRILGPSIEGARKSFHVLGIACCTHVEPAATHLFDEFLELGSGLGPPAEIAHRVRKICKERGAAVLYMPSIGMGETSIVLSNIRVAPLQVTSIGHPATTHSSEIDYFITEQDYCPAADTMSEKLLLLGRGEMPYCPSSAAPGYVRRASSIADDVSTVSVAIVGSLPKINTEFLQACERIRSECGKKVLFHFFALGARGIYRESLQRVLQATLQDSAVVHTQLPYAEYVDALGHCDLFLSPFPFGNLNGGIDCIMAGLVGVCKDGDEIFERINAGFLQRLGFPSWMVTHSVDQYVSSTCRLIQDSALRQKLSAELCPPNIENMLYSGDKEALGRKLLAALHAMPERTKPA